MSGKNKSMYAILGMVSIKPQSGYDIKKNIEEGLSIFWNESYGQIYKTLRKLLKENLIEKEHYSRKGEPNKDVYTITKKGESVLMDYLLKPSEKLTVRDEFSLKFFLGLNAPVERTIELLNLEVKKLKDQIERIKQKQEYTKSDIGDDYKRFYMQHMTKLGIQFFESKIKWCLEAAKKLKSMKVK